MTGIIPIDLQVMGMIFNHENPRNNLEEVKTEARERSIKEWQMGQGNGQRTVDQKTHIKYERMDELQAQKAGVLLNLTHLRKLGRRNLIPASTAGSASREEGTKEHLEDDIEILSDFSELGLTSTSINEHPCLFGRFVTKNGQTFEGVFPVTMESMKIKNWLNFPVRNTLAEFNP
ncbi:hypothetical protein JTB14_004276 [Gonioctena quinquepunctata]|nr:hypothetical protein JTB14_004276 [Gonioctena quinquepunctata]